MVAEKGPPYSNILKHTLFQLKLKHAMYTLSENFELRLLGAGIGILYLYPLFVEVSDKYGLIEEWLPLGN